MCAESPTDRVLTFLQSAREQNIPVRSGKWNPEEERYLRKLVELFCLGVLDEVAQKTSMRAWLAHMLNCCPMRISKKQMSGANFTGKAKFMKNRAAIDRMTQRQYDEVSDELCYLRANFLKQWAKDEFARRTAIDKATIFEEWYSKALDIVPHPKIAKNLDIVESKRWQPEPESTAKLQEQIEETLARQNCRRLDVYAPSSRSLKRQRVEARDMGIGEFMGFENLMAEACIPVCASPDVVSLGHTFYECLEHEPVPASWMTQLRPEPEMPPARTFAGIHNTIQPLAHERDAYSAIEAENQLRCNEYLSCPEIQVTAQLDFGLPSRWDHQRDTRDLPSRDMSVWEDNDLLLDGFSILTDTSLALWDDAENSLDAWGHSIFKPFHPDVQF